MLNGIKIMILEGSDVLKDNLDNIYIKKDYKGVFSDSSLLDELNKVGLKINVKEESTTDIIMLNFSYGYNSKESRQIAKKINLLNDEKNDLIRQKKENIEIRKQQKGNKDKKQYTDIVDYHVLWRIRVMGKKQPGNADNIKGFRGYGGKS